MLVYPKQTGDKLQMWILKSQLRGNLNEWNWIFFVFTTEITFKDRILSLTGRDLDLKYLLLLIEANPRQVSEPVDL